MKLAVYTDYPYRRQGDALFAERAFVLFLGELASQLDRLVLAGRLHPEEGRSERSHYQVSHEIDFVPLPHYESLARPAAALGSIRGAASEFSRVVDEVDAVWLLGPHPHCLVFAAIAARRRKPVFLGVRQDLRSYARTRHPGRRRFHVAADLLEGAYRLLARRCPAIVVGPDLARKYRHAKRLLPISVSLVRERDLLAAPPPRSYDGELTALSVGRIETEKNPLLLAEVLALLDPRWRIAVCGEGPLVDQLEQRLDELGIRERAELLGYVPLDGGLTELYVRSHALLHVSWTEGVPQVLFESFAAGLPVVATAVGGVSDAVGDDALLIPAGNAHAAAHELDRLASDEGLRERLTLGGLERVRAHTLEAECARVAAFLEGS